MTADNYLFLFVLGVLLFAVTLFVANKNTPEETKAMLDDEDIWP